MLPHPTFLVFAIFVGTVISKPLHDFRTCTPSFNSSAAYDWRVFDPTFSFPREIEIGARSGERDGGGFDFLRITKVGSLPSTFNIGPFEEPEVGIGLDPTRHPDSSSRNVGNEIAQFIIDCTACGNTSGENCSVELFDLPGTCAQLVYIEDRPALGYRPCARSGDQRFRFIRRDSTQVGVLPLAESPPTKGTSLGAGISSRESHISSTEYRHDDTRAAMVKLEIVKIAFIILMGFLSGTLIGLFVLGTIFILKGLGAGRQKYDGLVSLEK